MVRASQEHRWNKARERCLSSYKHKVTFFDTKILLSHQTSSATLKSRDGEPSCRMMAVREITDRGLFFCTQYTSKKCQDLDTNPRACFCFYWEPLDRQVIVRGRVERISRDEAERFFAQVPYEYKITSVVSQTDRPVAEKQALFDSYYKKSNELNQEQQISAPENWYDYFLISMI